MKIVAVGRNYAAHAQELGNAVPEEPMLFHKPETALMTGDSFKLPSFSQNIHFECELVVKVNRSLTNVSSEEAEAAIEAVALGLDFTARDLQDQMKAKGLPWEKAKAFDGSAYVSKQQNGHNTGQTYLFTLHVNGSPRQHGDSRLMLTGIADLLSYASRFFTIKPDDLLFTGTPAGVGQVFAGDVLEGFIGDVRFFRVQIEG